MNHYIGHAHNQSISFPFISCILYKSVKKWGWWPPPPSSTTSFRTLINNSVPFFIVIRGSLITVDLLTYPWMKFASDANALWCYDFSNLFFQLIMKCRNTEIYQVDDDKVFDPDPYHKQIKISIHGAKY